MKVLYFDCSSGISGNMTLGALSELIDDPHYLVNELKKLNVDGYHIHISKEKKNGITGTYVDVHLEHEHHHEHEHEHEHEHLHHEQLITIIMNIVIYSMLIKLLMKVKLTKKQKIWLNVSF